MSLAVQPYQYLPQMSEKDYQRLKESIERSGGLWAGHEIDVDENGLILDGYHREKVCVELGLPCPRRVRTDLVTEDQKFDFIWSVNMARRHLTIEQKRDMVREYLRRFPERSNRQVAEEGGVDDKTVGAVRREMETSAEIPQTVRPHTRPDQQRTEYPDQYDIDKPEPTYPPDHRGHAVVKLIVLYPYESEVERDRRQPIGDLPYPRESGQKLWRAELVMQTPIPDSGYAVDPFTREVGDRLRREILERPFLTMLAHAEKAGSR